MQARTTFSQFVLEADARSAQGGNLAALLDDVQRACASIGTAVSRGALQPIGDVAVETNAGGELQKPMDVLANDIMLGECSRSGVLRGMASEELAEPAAASPTGTYLLSCDPLDGSTNLEVNVTVGTIFSVLRAPERAGEPQIKDFLQPGTSQLAAGFALHGPYSMMIVTLGNGVHGFTFDRETGEYVLTQPAMRISEDTREFAINASNQRFWDPPIRHYVDECIEGRAGPRGEDFNMRWTASFVAEIYRILIRGGTYLYPSDSRDSAKSGRLRLLYEAGPMAMLVEQAGGIATTGRDRILDLIPESLHQRVPVVLGSRREVKRLTSYYAAHDRGEELAFESPLFKNRSMYRATSGD